MVFSVKEIAEGFEKISIDEVGFDVSYIDKVVGKYQFKLFKIFDLTPQQATIIKQLALSIGTDAAVHREVITCKVDKCDVVLGGSKRQIEKICDKLKFQPFGLTNLADDLISIISDELRPLKIRDNIFDWGNKTYLMGILNVTPDSFSDGGDFIELESAVAQAEKLSLCSDIIDIGGESTRPYSEEVSIDDEVSRVCPVIKSIRGKGILTPISIDTRNAKTAKESIKAGADIINDVSGGTWDDKMFDVVAEYQVPYVLMHSVGTPQDMQNNPNYKKIVDDVYLDLSFKIENAISRGVKKENLIIDIGIGFGKNLEHNLELLKRLREFKSLGCPLLAGVSRKSFMSKIVDIDLDEKDISTLAINSLLVSKGVDIVRVHNPSLHKKPLAIIDKLDRN